MKLFTHLLISLAVLGAISSAPLAAHGKKHHAAESAQSNKPGNSPTTDGASAGNLTAEHGTMSEMMGDEAIDRSAMSPGARLIAWFGHLHPAIVHFPIAFFPAAWFTAIVGRRRPAFSTPVQFLVVAGGIFAPIAAIAGWIAAADADPSNILTYHHWIGTGVGIAGLILGIWAWRRPWEDRGAGMILALTAMTVAIVFQAGLGAIVTHGIEHLMF